LHPDYNPSTLRVRHGARTISLFLGGSGDRVSGRLHIGPDAAAGKRFARICEKIQTAEEREAAGPRAKGRWPFISSARASRARNCSRAGPTRWPGPRGRGEVVPPCGTGVSFPAGQECPAYRRRLYFLTRRPNTGVAGLGASAGFSPRGARGRVASNPSIVSG